jgi:hypothetical protein
MNESFGKTNSEKFAEENKIARQIVKEISQFGVTDRQRYSIMYYLSLELENIENVKKISALIKESCPEVSLTTIYGVEQDG